MSTVEPRLGPTLSGDDDPAAVALAAVPRFSVAMNVHNGEAVIAEAIDSVLAQSFTDWELVIWDDCSTDRTAEICASYSDPRVRYFLSTERAGLDRNLPARQARGEWLAFLDHDDIWLPNKLSAQNALIQQDEEGRLGLVYGRTTRFDQRGRTWPFDRWHRPGRLPEGDILVELLRKPIFIAVSSLAVRRAVFSELGGIPPNILHSNDYYLCLEIARRYRAACAQELCCLYRVHPNSMSHTHRMQTLEEALLIIENFSDPAYQRLLRTQRRVLETCIGFEEIRARGAWRQGVSRILRQGSLTFLASRPFVRVVRRIRNAVMQWS